MQKDCAIVAHTTAVDNVQGESTYDLLVSISSKDDCVFTCEIKDNLENLNVEHITSYSFLRRNYHLFKFVNLSQYKKYAYICNSEPQKNFLTEEDSEVYDEITFPKSRDEIKIAAFGDWSDCEEGKKTLSYLEKNMSKYDLSLILGDLAYNLHTDDGKVGNKFMKFIQPFTKKTPFMISLGNHEIKTTIDNYVNRFNMPNKNQSNNLYYSFDIRNAHFVSIPSDLAISTDKFSQAEIDAFIVWLRQDLAATNKKWKIVFMHRPLYCSDDSKDTCVEEAEKLRSLFEDIFIEFNVDMVIAGHMHNYERLYPLYKGQVDFNSISEDKNTYFNPKFPVYVICGTGGNSNGAHNKCKDNF